MSTSTEQKTTYTLAGSCHCKALHFTTRNVSLASPSKCSCSICSLNGRINVMIGAKDLSLKLVDGTSSDIDYLNVKKSGHDALGVYSFGVTEQGGEGHQFYHCHCKVCAIPVFVAGRIDAMGGAVNVVNLRCLDLAAVGLDIKDVTDPAKITFCDGAKDFACRKSEPWEGQAW